MSQVELKPPYGSTIRPLNHTGDYVIMFGPGQEQIIATWLYDLADNLQLIANMNLEAAPPKPEPLPAPLLQPVLAPPPSAATMTASAHEASMRQRIAAARPMPMGHPQPPIPTAQPFPVAPVVQSSPAAPAVPASVAGSPIDATIEPPAPVSPVIFEVE